MVQAFEHSLAHVMAMIERVDLLIQMQVWHARQSAGLGSEYAGLLITDADIDHLLAQPTGTPRWVTAQGAWTADEAQSALQSLTAEIRERERVSQEQGVLLRICLLQTVFGLSDSAVDILLVCLLPALDTRYAMLYAYLQNDVNLKYPSVDLVLNLLCASFAEKVQLRRWLDDASPLRHYRLLQTQDDNPQIPYLQQALRVD
ncbi:MAG: hypothetical protein AAFQ07_10155, partial [Chloroflexota bacterium]